MGTSSGNEVGDCGINAFIHQVDTFSKGEEFLFGICLLFIERLIDVTGYLLLHYLLSQNQNWL